MRKLLTLVSSGPLLAISIVTFSLITASVVFTPANAAPNSIEINSISEVSCTSVEILFESSVPKKSLVNYVITAAVDPSAGQPKNIKKIIKTKATGLITAEIKNLNPKVAYKFSVSAKTNKGKMINSEAVEHISLCDLMDTLSNLPADWGNPKPTPTPTPTPAAAPAAAPTVISVAAIAGVTAPVTSGTPVTTTTAGTGYTGTVSWSTSPATFAAATVYTATITLTPTSGYTLTGVAANFFTVAGATSNTNSANSGVITAVFPATAAPTVISAAVIAGVTAPITGATPVTTTTAGTGYTGTVIWASSGGALVGNFVAATVYTATITLTPTSGYTLTGVAANFFTVAGATPVTNSANAGVITAVFYMVGATGPGGGIVYYVSASDFTSTGSACNTTCKYLEAAPSGWNSGADPQKPWATGTADSGNAILDVGGITNDNPEYNNALGVGLGYANSLAIVTQNGAGTTYAAGAARAYTGGSKTDWYLPTTAELNLLCQWNRGVAINVATVCTGGNLNSGTYGAGSAGFVADFYWSSSERNNDNAWLQFFGNGVQSVNFKGDATRYVRPVRAF